MTRILFVLLATLGLSGCASSSKTEVPEIQRPSVATLMQQGQQAEKLKQYEMALKNYIEALEQQPQSADILYRIGEVQSQLGNTGYALKALQDALTTEPDHINAMTSLALINLTLGDNEQAKRYLTKALDLDQQRLAQLNQTVIVGEKPELQTLDADSPLPGYNAMGILNDLDGNYEAARQYYELVLQQQPGNAPALTNLGYSYYLDGNLKQAEIKLRLATQKQPDFKRAWHNLGLVYVRMNHYKRALVALKRVMPEPDALNDLGYFAMLEGRYAQAQELFLKAIDSSPTYFAKAQDNLEKLQELQGKLATASSHQSVLSFPSKEAQIKAEMLRAAPLPSAQ